MLLAHKIELRPTEQQAGYLDRACGSRRHAFNHFFRRLKKGEKPGYSRFKKQGLHDRFAVRKPGRRLPNFTIVSATNV